MQLAEQMEKNSNLLKLEKKAQFGLRIDISKITHGEITSMTNRDLDTSVEFNLNTD